MLSNEPKVSETHKLDIDIISSTIQASKSLEDSRLAWLLARCGTLLQNISQSPDLTQFSVACEQHFWIPTLLNGCAFVTGGRSTKMGGMRKSGLDGGRGGNYLQIGQGGCGTRSNRMEISRFHDLEMFVGPLHRLLPASNDIGRVLRARFILQNESAFYFRPVNSVHHINIQKAVRPKTNATVNKPARTAVLFRKASTSSLRPTASTYAIPPLAVASSTFLLAVFNLHTTGATLKIVWGKATRIGKLAKTSWVPDVNPSGV